jgi:hypothetical protein
MSGMICTTCGDQSNDATPLHCQRPDCPQGPPPTFFHAMPKPDGCEHDFKDWRDDEDGCGGSLYCAKCGMSARHYSMMMSP